MNKPVIFLVALSLIVFASSLSAADFDGDGTNDIAVFRPGSGMWAIRGGNRVYFGKYGDQPVPGDYNGNGTVDIAVFRPSNGLWAVNGGLRAYFGKNGDQALPGVMGGGGGGGQWTRNGNDIYYTSGKVGIGTAHPSKDLHVYSSTDNSVARVETDGPLGNTAFYEADCSNGGNSGLSLQEDGVNKAYIYWEGSNERLVVSEGIQERIVLDDGNLGVGTTNANHRLTVKGRSDNTLPVRISNSDQGSDLYLGFGATSGSTYSSIWSSGGANLALQEAGGNVGIGTTTPGWQLEVSGAVMLEHFSSPPYQANHAGIYCSYGELYAIDGYGISTLISPHDNNTGEWIFYSKNIKTGRVVRVDMERMVRAIEELTGETFMVEKWEEQGEQ